MKKSLTSIELKMLREIATAPEPGIRLSDLPGEEDEKCDTRDTLLSHGLVSRRNVDHDYRFQYLATPKGREVLARGPVAAEPLTLETQSAVPA